MPSHNSAQTGLMSTWDASDVTVMVNGQELYGFGEDTMYTASYSTDRISITQDPQGTATASKNNKTGATITINIAQTSPCTKQLLDLANAGTEFPVDIVSSTTHISATHCFITKIPDDTGAAAVSNRAWQINALNMDETPVSE